MVIETTTGSFVKKNEPILTFFHTQPLDEADLVVLKSIATVGPKPPAVQHRLLEVVDLMSTKA